MACLYVCVLLPIYLILGTIKNCSIVLITNGLHEITGTNRDSKSDMLDIICSKEMRINI